MKPRGSFYVQSFGSGSQQAMLVAGMNRIAA